MTTAALIPDWPAPPVVHALTTYRHWDGQGASMPPFDRFNLGNCAGPEGDNPQVVESNRKLLTTLAALPAAPHWLRQVHGVTVQRFDTPPGDAAPAVADASVTSVPGVVLAILTADCLPVLFCAEDGSEVAAAHAGWRGLVAGVLEATLRAMNTPPDRVLAWLGPAAGPAAYEVGDEVRAQFVDSDPTACAAFVATRPGHYLCDLYALARQRLYACEVNRVYGGGRCTIREADLFFSHRRDGRSGRQASLIWVA